MGLTVENKQIAVPGETLAQGMDYLPGEGAIREGENLIASRMGLVNIDGRAVKVIPLSGIYLPKRDDVIICKVIDVLMSGWRVDINSAYSAMLPLKDASAEYIPKGADLRRFFDLGEYLIAVVTNVTSQKLVDISMRGPGLWKIRGGRIINVTPCKVPRIIGKQGSMVSMIKEATGAKITVGQNGVVWIQCEDPEKELIAVNTIRKIEKEAHISGLTERIKEYLGGQK
jgi:exosome complex component RRP4